jgi:hypothetical protein
MTTRQAALVEAIAKAVAPYYGVTLNKPNADSLCEDLENSLAALTETPEWQPMDTLARKHRLYRTTLLLIVKVGNLNSWTMGYWNGQYWQDMAAKCIEPIGWALLPSIPAAPPTTEAANERE